MRRTAPTLSPTPAAGGDLRGECKSLVSFLAVTLLCVCTGFSAAFGATRDSLQTGRDIYEAACVNCHGATGEGAPVDRLGFDPPATFPDFTRCDQTSVESDLHWRAIVRDGGRARGFSPIMPAFGDALTARQIATVVSQLRAFCKDDRWPRGELNLPKALLTEKAFPENELVWSHARATRAPAFDEGEIAYERRIGKLAQMELVLPYAFRTTDGGTRVGGMGDVAAALKRVLISRLSPGGDRGQMLALQGELSLPTGSERKGSGAGQSVFGIAANYGALFPGSAFLQAQLGADLPAHSGPGTAYLHVALGRSFAADGGYGRLWTPMIEAVAERDLQSGARTHWDAVPEFQVTLSSRQHVRFNAGYRVPVSDTEGRPRQFLCYVLWDWFDGGLTEGW